MARGMGFDKVLDKAYNVDKHKTLTTKYSKPGGKTVGEVLI
jgi:hypothetical protein